MKHLRYLATTLSLALLLLILPACQTLDALVEDIDSLDLPSLAMGESESDNLVYDGKCPRVEIVEELRTLNEFTNAQDTGDYNLISRVTLAKINTACSHSARSVTVDLKMAFEGVLGPRARNSEKDQPFFAYPFFVAITNAGGDIIAKEIFAANISYKAGENRQTYFENMRQIIPIEARDRGGRYKILIGFQLDPDQLAYNRETIKKTPPAFLQGKAAP